MVELVVSLVFSCTHKHHRFESDLRDALAVNLYGTQLDTIPKMSFLANLTLGR